jgi:ATP-dependent Lon protease
MPPGEITLRGEITPIGGLKEKMLAALRGGIKTVIIPNDNERELSEVVKIPCVVLRKGRVISQH